MGRLACFTRNCVSGSRLGYATTCRIYAEYFWVKGHDQSTPLIFNCHLGDQSLFWHARIALGDHPTEQRVLFSIPHLANLSSFLAGGLVKTLAQRARLDVLVQLALSFASSFAPYDIRKFLPFCLSTVGIWSQQS
jgi:hypothetical protein